MSGYDENTLDALVSKGINNKNGNFNMDNEFINIIFDIINSGKGYQEMVYSLLEFLKSYLMVDSVSIYELINKKTDIMYEYTEDGIVKDESNPRLYRNMKIIDRCFNSNGVFICGDIKDLDIDLNEFYYNNGVNATLQAVIGNNKSILGVISFNMMNETKVWNHEEIGIIKFIAKFINCIFDKKELEEEQLEQMSILDRDDPIISQGAQNLNYRIREELKENNFRTKGNVIAFDLNRFKFVNDTFGYKNGNIVLEKIYKYLETLTEKKNIFKFGGDGFIIVLGSKGSEETMDLAKEIVARFKEPWQVEVRSCYCDISISIIPYEEIRDTDKDVTETVEFALGEAKLHSGNKILLFNSELKHAISRKEKLIYIIRNAVNDKSFSVFYQPIYSFDKNKFTKAEALIRLINPELGIISPQEFIPIAEEIGVIDEMGLFVFDVVCKKVKSLVSEGVDFENIAVNISGIHFMNKDFVDDIIAILKKNGISGEKIQIEITESAIINSISRAKVVMERLEQYGVTFAIDDFGTGYSGVNYIFNLPFKIIKLDKTFIDQLEGNKNINVLIKRITAMSQEMGLRIVAEGIEHMSQLDILKKYGCDYIQGYLFSRPINGDGIDKFLGKKPRKINSNNIDGNVGNVGKVTVVDRLLRHKIKSNSNKVRFSLTLWIVGITTFVSLLLGSFGISAIDKNNNRLFAEKICAKSEAVSKNIGGRIQGMGDATNRLLSADSFKNILQAANMGQSTGVETLYDNEISRYLTQDINSDRYIYQAYVFDSKDELVATTKAGASLSLSEDKIKKLRAGESVISLGKLGVGETAQKFVGVSNPIINDGVYRGYILITSEINSSEQGLNNSGIVGYDTIIMTSDGKESIHSGDVDLDTLEALKYKVRQLDKISENQKLVEGEIGNTTKVGCYQNISGTNLVLIMAQDKDIINSILYSTSTDYLNLSIIIVIMVTIVVLVVLYEYFKPLNIILNTMNDVGNGNLGARIPYKKRDEYGEIAGTFNKLMDGLTVVHDDLRASEEKYKILSDKSEGIIFEWFLQSDKVNISKNWFIKLGYYPKEESTYMRKLGGDVVFADDVDRFNKWVYETGTMHKDSVAVFRIGNSSNEYIWFKATSNVIFNSLNEPVKAIGTFEDISKVKKRESGLRKLAQKDGLTGLYNKVTTERMVSKLLREPTNKNSVLLMIDLDNFKTINDTLGHKIGDKILVDFGVITREYFGDEAVVGRIGGDEFIVYLNDCEFREEIVDYVDEYIKVLSDSIFSEYKSYNISASVGIAINEEFYEGYAELFARSDYAMYEAKNSGKSKSFLYNETLKKKQEKENEFALEIKGDIEKDKCYIKTREIRGNLGGGLSGIEIIPSLKELTMDSDEFELLRVAKKYNCLNQYSRLYLKTAFEYIKEKQGNTKEQLYIRLCLDSINLKKIVKDFVGYVEEFNVKPNKITVVCCQHMLKLQADKGMELLSKLKGLGFKINVLVMDEGMLSFDYVINDSIDGIVFKNDLIDKCEEDREKRELFLEISRSFVRRNKEVILYSNENQVKIINSYVDFTYGYI